MSTDYAVRTTPEAAPQYSPIEWNGVPLLLSGQPHRTSKIVRTKVVTPAQRRQYSRIGWPRDMVIIREHSLKLPSDDMTVKVVTNAEEAADEIPEKIVTPIRDTGTYRDAVVYFRGRPVRSFVSARLAVPADAQAPVPEAAAIPTIWTPEILRTVEDVLKSGILVREAALPSKLSPEDRLFVNLLIAVQPDNDNAPLSLESIGRIIGISRETVRRRREDLLATNPELRGVIAAFRGSNAKGDPNPPPSASAARPETDEDDE